MNGPANDTMMFAVDILMPRRIRLGFHCTGLPQPKPPAKPLDAA